ncbi:MAG: sulfatase-like hydrolase/transferase, partial [Bacteroidales bacterium]|nr:sulfatase-like hydrolase/transferase [Bacteroidales bacterium]
GKWGLGNAGTTGDPAIKGFDAFTGYTNQVEAHFYYGDSIDKIIHGKTEKVVVSPGEYTYDIAMRDALEFIRKNKDNKFFAYLPVRLPHAEYLAPENDMQLYLDESGQSIFEETPFPGDGHYAAQAFPNAAYAAMVSLIDKDIGIIVDLLKELEIEESTLLFFTSDNGATNGLGHTTGYFTSNGPLRGQKGTLYEGGIRVPMIVWGPERVSAGRICDHKWAMWDLFPTFSELAGKPIPADIDGITATNLILNKGKTTEHDHLYWEYGTPWLTLFVQTVIKGEWKLVKVNRNIESVQYELYNLNDDISESENLVEAHPQKVAELDELIVQSHSKPELSEFDYSYLPDAMPVPPDQLYTETGKKGGLTGEYFTGTDFNKTIKKQTDPAIWFQWGHNPQDGLPEDQFSVRWTGQLMAK